MKKAPETSGLQAPMGTLAKTPVGGPAQAVLVIQPLKL
jgi:hypothetical protein